MTNSGRPPIDPDKVRIADFLKDPTGLTLIIGGSYVFPNRYDPQGKPRSYACRTTRVSPSRVLADVPVNGRIGDRLTCYFPEFGRFDAFITDIRTGGFLLVLEMTDDRRVRFAGKLAWLEKKQRNPSIRDVRKDARIIPESPHSTLAMADGSIHGCFIIDMSVAGVAVSAHLQPPIGTPLAIGSCIGRVVRHFPEGFAVRFVRTQNRQDLNRLLVRSPR